MAFIVVNRFGLIRGTVRPTDLDFCILLYLYIIHLPRHNPLFSVFGLGHFHSFTLAVVVDSDWFTNRQSDFGQVEYISFVKFLDSHSDSNFT